MKKQKFISGMAAVLTVCMNVSALPVSAISSQVFAIDDLVEFTDKTDRGKWDKTSGNGSISFQDGQGDNGFMTVKSNGDTIFADTSTTKRADGFVEMDMKMTEAPTGARMAIIFRYNSPTDWEGIGIDHGLKDLINGVQFLQQRKSLLQLGKNIICVLNIEEVT